MLSLRAAAIAVLAAAITASAAPITASGVAGSERNLDSSTDPVARAPPRFTPTGSSVNTNICTPLELVYFRSVAEPQNRLGLIGDPLYAQILKRVGKASAYNVQFNTVLEEEFFTNLAGAKDASDWLNRRSAECPNQRYIVAGFSKGAVPLHFLGISPAARERVVASLAIGDVFHRQPFGPFFGASWPSNGPDSIISLCNQFDFLCSPGPGSNVASHLAPAYLPQLPAAVKKIIGLYRISRGESPNK